MAVALQARRLALRGSMDASLLVIGVIPLHAAGGMARADRVQRVVKRLDVVL